MNKYLPMSLEISQETQTRLADEAQKEGVSIDALLQRHMDERNVSLKSISVVPTREDVRESHIPQHSLIKIALIIAIIHGISLRFLCSRASAP